MSRFGVTRLAAVFALMLALGVGTAVAADGPGETTTTVPIPGIVKVAPNAQPAAVPSAPDPGYTFNGAFACPVGNYACLAANNGIYFGTPFYGYGYPYYGGYGGYYGYGYGYGAPALPDYVFTNAGCAVGNYACLYGR